MPPAPPPNDRLAGLVAVVGESDARELVQLFLDGFPGYLRELSSGDRARCHRAAHSLKSSALQMGMPELARRMAELEKRLSEAGGAVAADDMAGTASEFARAEGSLRAFAAGR